MKNFYSLLMTGFIAGSITAQTIQIPSNMAVRPPASHAVESNSIFKHSQNLNDRAVTTGYFDYGTLAGNDVAYIWPVNKNFVIADTAGGNYSNLNFTGLAINPFDVYVDENDPIGTEIVYSSYPSNFSYTIDSIFVVITHENNSGLKDYYGVQIVPLTGSGGFNATPSAILWQQKDSTTTSLSPGGNWLGTGSGLYLEYAPNYTTTAGQKVGIVFFYDGPKADSCGIRAGYLDNGQNKCLTPSPYKTTWLGIPYISANPLAARTLTTGATPPEYYPVQDLAIVGVVTFNDVTGISDNALNKTATLYQNIPNPSNGTTLVKYDLAKSANVTITFTDLTGKVVKEINEGQMSAGNYQLDVNTADLSKGSYFYTLKTSNGVSLTKKMVITE